MPTLFDEAQYLGKESSSVVTNLEEDDEIKAQEEEEKKVPYYEEPYCKRTLKDIKEDPEEYQNFEGSSSIHSGCLRRLISDGDYNKVTSDFTKFSKEDESGTSSSEEHRNTTVVLKSSQIHKKGIFFFNERTLTLESSKRR